MALLLMHSLHEVMNTVDRDDEPGSIDDTLCAGVARLKRRADECNDRNFGLRVPSTLMNSREPPWRCSSISSFTLEIGRRFYRYGLATTGSPLVFPESGPVAVQVVFHQSLVKSRDHAQFPAHVFSLEFVWELKLKFKPASNRTWKMAGGVISLYLLWNFEFGGIYIPQIGHCG